MNCFAATTLFLLSVLPGSAWAEELTINLECEKGPCPSGMGAMLQSSGAKCSGAMIGPDLFLTAQHCISKNPTCAGTTIVAIHYEQGVPKLWTSPCEGVVAAGREGSAVDIALLRTRERTFPSPLEVDAVRESDSLTVAKVTSLGWKEGVTTLKWDTGDCSVFTRHDTKIPLEQRTILSTRCNVVRGNSGGPLLNQHGKVVGVLSKGDQTVHSFSGEELKRVSEFSVLSCSDLQKMDPSKTGQVLSQSAWCQTPVSETARLSGFIDETLRYLMRLHAKSVAHLRREAPEYLPLLGTYVYTPVSQSPTSPARLGNLRLLFTFVPMCVVDLKEFMRGKWGKKIEVKTKINPVYEVEFSRNPANGDFLRSVYGPQIEATAIIQTLIEPWLLDWRALVGMSLFYRRQAPATESSYEMESSHGYGEVTLRNCEPSSIAPLEL